MIGFRTMNMIMVLALLLNVMMLSLFLFWGYMCFKKWVSNYDEAKVILEAYEDSLHRVHISIDSIIMIIIIRKML